MAGKTGNTNALKHGLYAKRFTDAEKIDLGKMPPDDLRQEIAMLRVVTDRIFELLTADPTQTEGKPISPDDVVKLTNSLTTAVSTIGASIRTHAILNGSYNPLNDALLEALTRVPAYEKTENE